MTALELELISTTSVKACNTCRKTFCLISKGAAETMISNYTRREDFFSPTIATTVLFTLWGLIPGVGAHANGHEPWPPAPAFEIVEKEIPQGDNPNSAEYKRHVEYALKLPEQDETIFLARAYHGDAGSYLILGFDAKSFKIVSLEPDALLHANWRTAVQGSGSYVCESDLLLSKKDGKWVEIFRDTHDGYSKFGLAHTSSKKLTFSFNSHAKALLISTAASEFDFYEGEAYPLGRQVSIGIEEHNKGLPAFASQYSIVTDWLCKLENGELTWGPGACYLELGTHPFAINEVVTFLRTSSQIPSLKDSTDEDVASNLRNMNPQFGESGVCWGIVRIKNDLPMYEENRLHRYRMES